MLAVLVGNYNLCLLGIIEDVRVVKTVAAVVDVVGVVVGYRLDVGVYVFSHIFDFTVLSRAEWCLYLFWYFVRPGRGKTGSPPIFYFFPWLHPKRVAATHKTTKNVNM